MKPAVLMTGLLLAAAGAAQAHAAAPAAALPPVASRCSVHAKPGDDLQKAVDRLPGNRPAVLCLAKGEYLLHGLVSIQRNDVTVRGAGHDTVLRMADDVQQPLLVIGDYANEAPARRIRNVTIANLQMVGGKAEHEFMPEHPYLSNSAVVIRAGENIRLTGLEASHCRSACLLSERDSHDLLVDHNEIHDAVWDGVSFNSTSRVRLLDNYIHDNVAAAITVEELNDSEIRGNRLERNGSQGVYLSNARRNRFIDNQFIGNKLSGALLTCSIRYRTPEILCWDNSISQDNVFEGNTFQGSPHTYTIGVDRAANCKAPGFKPNVWRNNQADAAGFDPQVEQFGNCVRND